MASFTCPPGAICPPSAGEPIGANKTQIYYSTATTVTQGSDGKVNGAERVLYIEKNGSYQPAAISKDGGKTYNFSDPKYPLMDGVAGADLQNDLNNPASGIHKNVDAGIAKVLPKAGIPPTQQQSVVAATANQATNPGAAESQGGDPNNAALLADISTPAKGTRMSFSQTLRYPETLKSEHQDVISFNMLKYEPRKLSEGGTGNLGTFGQRSDFKTRIIGKVTLPIPNGISDTNSVSWNGETITSAQKALADLASAGITGGLNSAATTAGNQVNQAVAAAPEIAQGLASYFTEQAVGVTNLLSRTQGAVQNPNLELLFSAPTLRPFNFTFKLASRSETESKIIRSIIRFFKQGMSPQRSQSNLFLKAPHTFQIQYLHRNEEHKFLNKFKECALQSFNVSYTPEGQYATFTDGAMVSYQITMQLQELEPIFNDDYTSLDQNKDTEIGY